MKSLAQDLAARKPPVLLDQAQDLKNKLRQGLGMKQLLKKDWFLLSCLPSSFRTSQESYQAPVSRSPLARVVVEWTVLRPRAPQDPG